MEKIKLEMIPENKLVEQEASVVTGLDETYNKNKQETSLKSLITSNKSKKINTAEKLKEIYSEIDPDGSTTWLLLKVLQYSFTKRIFFYLINFHFYNPKEFIFFLFGINILCFLILNLTLFGYYREFFSVNILVLAWISFVLNIIRAVLYFLFKLRHVPLIESLFSIYYLIAIIVILAKIFYFELIVFDWISSIIISSCTSFVLLFNVLMSYKLFKYMKYILPFLFFTTILFFSIFYKFKYFLIAYIACMVLSTFYNFMFRVFYLRSLGFSDILYFGVITFYIYSFDLAARSEILNKN